MASEQLGVFAAGIIGLLGSLVGALISLVSNYLVFKWNRRNENLKEERKIIENRINDVEDYQGSMVEKVNKAYVLAEKCDDEFIAHELLTVLNTIEELSCKSHSVLGLLILNNEELGNLLVSIHNGFSEFHKYCSQLLQVNGPETQKKEELDKAKAIRDLVRHRYGLIISQFDKYRIYSLKKEI